MAKAMLALLGLRLSVLIRTIHTLCEPRASDSEHVETNERCTSVRGLRSDSKNNLAAGIRIRYRMKETHCWYNLELRKCAVSRLSPINVDEGHTDKLLQTMTSRQEGEGQKWGSSPHSAIETSEVTVIDYYVHKYTMCDKSNISSL